MSSKAEEKVTPDSQKSTLDQAKEGLTNAGDKVAQNVQPCNPSRSLLFDETDELTSLPS